MRIRVRYSEILKQVLAMILIPVALTFFFIWLMAFIDKYVESETAMQIMIFGGAFAMIGFAAFVVMRIIMADGELEYDRKGISLRLDAHSLLYPVKDFYIPYSNIDSAGMTEDAEYRKYASIRTRSPKKSYIIIPAKNDLPAFEAYWEDLSEVIRQYNESNAAQPALQIKNRGLYENKFFKVIAVISILIGIVLIGMKIYEPSSVDTWKLIAYFCYALSLIGIVVRSNRKKDTIS